MASSSRLDPDYGASRPHLSFAAGKAKRNLDRPDFGAKVKARILGSRPGGTVVVSLVLENHAARDLQGKQLEDCQLPPHLMAQARDLVEAVEEVEQESDNQESFEEQRNHAERVDSEYRRELMRILRLHPGGVEIVAEMTPEQLRALAHKLGARNPKLRALMN